MTMDDVNNNIDGPSHFPKLNTMIMEDSTPDSPTHHLGKEEASKPSHGTDDDYKVLLACVSTLERKLNRLSYFTIKVIHHSTIALMSLLQVEIKNQD